MPDTVVPIQPVTLMQAASRRSATGPSSERTPIEMQEREREHDRRVPEREPEADAQRALALAHQLAGRVVDRGDVVGVERVAQPERVGGDADPDRERAGRPEVVVARRDECEQRREPERRAEPPTTATIITSVRRCPPSSDRQNARNRMQPT